MRDSIVLTVCDIDDGGWIAHLPSVLSTPLRQESLGIAYSFIQSSLLPLMLGFQPLRALYFFDLYSSSRALFFSSCDRLIGGLS